MTRSFTFKSLAASCLVAIAGTAQAADIAPPPDESGWTFTLAPYVWLSGLSGDVAAFGAPAVDMDLSISDALSHLDIGLMGAGEARNGRFVIAADLYWVKLSADRDTPFGVLAENAELTVKNTMATGLVGYSVLDDGANVFDLVAGARLWSVSNELSFSGGLLGGTSLDQRETWIDPVVGFKGHFDLNDSFYVQGWALAGGFGVSSDFMWDVEAGIGYRFTEKFSALAAFRALGVDYDKDGFVYDVIQTGPMLGAVFTF